METPTQTAPPVDLDRLVLHCIWCGKYKRHLSDWEQQHTSGTWHTLCNPCANRRLKNPWNALIPLRRISLQNVKEHAPSPAGAHSETGFEVQVTQDSDDKAAGGGCCVSACSPSSIPGKVRVLLCQVVSKETGEILSRHMELGDAKKAAGARIDRGETRPTVRTTYEWITEDQQSTLLPFSQSPT